MGEVLSGQIEDGVAVGRFLEFAGTALGGGEAKRDRAAQGFLLAGQAEAALQRRKAGERLVVRCHSIHHAPGWR